MNFYDLVFLPVFYELNGVTHLWLIARLLDCKSCKLYECQLFELIPSFPIFQAEIESLKTELSTVRSQRSEDLERYKKMAAEQKRLFSAGIKQVESLRESWSNHFDMIGS